MTGQWWLKTGLTGIAWLLLIIISAAPVAAGTAPTAGARRVSDGERAAPTQGQTANSSPGSFQEITGAFTAPPTDGTLGDAIEASRATFSTAEPIEFDAILFESGLSGTTVDLQLYIFDPRGRLAAGAFLIDDIGAPSDRTDFFIQLDAGSLPAGQFKWAMVIIDAFGNLFVTPFQALAVQ